MSFWQILRIAWDSIRAAKLRSLLTTLGIVIGIAAVITVVALGTGAQREVQQQLDALGTDLVSITPGQSYWRGFASGERVALTTEDAFALMRDGFGIRAVVPAIGDDYQIKYANRNVNEDVLGTTAQYPEVHRMEIAVGRWFSEADDDARRRVAVLGDEVVSDLEVTPMEVLGEDIQIRGIHFEVIGVLAPKGQSAGRDDPDETVFIPFRTAEHRVVGHDRLRSITVQVTHSDSMNVAMVSMERVLRREHGLRIDEDNDFRFRDRTEFLSARAEANETLTFLLAGIAAVSLIVGGIGIMNIMLVSVTERTREIGLRKALGATRRSVLLQFLVEAVALCLVGGVGGIVVGVGGAAAMSSFRGWETAVSWPSILLAVGFSVAVGIFFGVVPARQASLLDPIEALRHE